MKPDSYYLTEVLRKGKPKWVIADAHGPDFAVFKNKRTAEATLKKLLNGKAQFCECGQWVNHENQKNHQCIAEYQVE